MINQMNVNPYTGQIICIDRNKKGDPFAIIAPTDPGVKVMIAKMKEAAFELAQMRYANASATHKKATQESLLRVQAVLQKRDVGNIQTADTRGLKEGQVVQFKICIDSLGLPQAQEILIQGEGKLIKPFIPAPLPIPAQTVTPVKKKTADYFDPALKLANNTMNNAYNAIIVEAQQVEDLYEDDNTDCEDEDEGDDFLPTEEEIDQNEVDNARYY